MSDVTRTFAVMARGGLDMAAPTRPPVVTGYPPRVTQDGQQTIMKLCPCCDLQMPHLIGYTVCILCAMDDESDSQIVR